MSDTPRTDAAILHAQIDLGRVERVVHHDFARQLERELAEAKACIKSRQNALDALYKSASETDAKFNSLREGMETLVKDWEDVFPPTERTYVANEVRALLAKNRA